MKIREAVPSDIPEIVQVLKLSLGETDLPLSEEIWNFKHVNNPFGKSLVLIAEEDGKIIGVRAFMKWDWICQGKTYKAYRAVDTATHPKHQGKGVFKKLTLEAVKIAREAGDDLIFNTPNDQSRPGYLKMGWKKVDKIRVGLKPVFLSIFRAKRSIVDFDTKNTSNKDELEKLCKNWNHRIKSTNKNFTPKSAQYLKWRFEENPLQEYKVSVSPDFYLAGYIKNRKSLKELRITECIYTEKKTLSVVKKEINFWSKKLGAHIVSFSPEMMNFGLSVSGHFGPILTVRELNIISELNPNLMKIENWSYSLGDLELF